jgi:hypothetical protein
MDLKFYVRVRTYELKTQQWKSALRIARAVCLETGRI